MRLQEGERILHELRPEAPLLGIWFFTKCLPAGLVGAFLAFWFSAVIGVIAGIFDGVPSRDPHWPFSAGGSIALIGGTVVLVCLVCALIYCGYLRRTYVYYVTNQRCIFRGGILRRVERSVHYHKITDVERSQTIVERLLGISTLKIFTAGTSSLPVFPFGGERAEITMVGLKDNETPAATIHGILKNFRATGE